MKVKALFLLFVFLLNSAVGLNCALQKRDDCCKEVGTHTPNPSIQLQQYQNHTALIADDAPCCQKAVNNFALLAKVVPQPLKILMPVHFAVMRSANYYEYQSAPVMQTGNQSRIDKQERPPTPDIRIIIKSFQI